MIELYILHNDLFTTNIEDVVEFVFLTKKEAEEYKLKLEEYNKDYMSYYIKTVYLTTDDDKEAIIKILKSMTKF